MDLSPPRSRPVEEFDEYADAYDAGMGNPIKRLVGSSPADFLRIKMRWLMDDVRRWKRPSGPLHFLDYGCGQGDFLGQLASAGLTSELAGCDVSTRMLEAAREKWNQAQLPDWFSPTEHEIASRAHRYDVVTISAVLHHVPLADRPEVYANLHQLLKPTGRLYVFEHNPYNPVTVWVVRNTPIDQNAILMPASQIRRDLQAAGLANFMTRYLMFFPPRFTWLHGVEKVLGRIPVGGQYVIRAEPVIPE